MKINLFNYTITIKKKKIKQKIWKPKTYGKHGLDVPVAPNGYLHRWIRQEGIDRRHIKKSGIQLVKAKDYRQSFATVEKGKFKGCIGLGGLILARMPEEMLNERR
jgi:hypothetical protein